jgi:hypothetical protein
MTAQEPGDQARQQHDDHRVHDDEDEHCDESTAEIGIPTNSALSRTLVDEPGLTGSSDPRVVAMGAPKFSVPALIDLPDAAKVF